MLIVPHLNYSHLSATSSAENSEAAGNILLGVTSPGFKTSDLESSHWLDVYLGEEKQIDKVVLHLLEDDNWGKW